MDDPDRRILDASISLIAEVGIRGAALRKIGQRAGIHFTNLSKKYGSKDALVAECFAEVARRDLTRFRNTVHQSLHLQLGEDAILQLLWMACDDFGSSLRNEGIVLAELLLASESDPVYADICANWLTARREQLRRLADHLEVEANAFDILGIILMSEIMFAVSCHESIRYRLLSRYGLEVAYRCLADRSWTRDTGVEKGLIEQFYLSPPPATDTGPIPDRKRRDETIKKIVEAAVSLIEESGVQAVTIKAVSDRAGVSSTLSNYYFDSINDIYYAGIHRIFEETHGRAAKAAQDLENVYSDILIRADPAEIPRRNQLIYRGIVELLLAGARDERHRTLAVSTRQLIGSVTFAATSADQQDLAMRLRSSAYSLWAMPTLILVPLLAGEPGWDFAAQSRLAVTRLLGVESGPRMPAAEASA